MLVKDRLVVKLDRRRVDELVETGKMQFMQDQETPGEQDAPGEEQDAPGEPEDDRGEDDEVSPAKPKRSRSRSRRRRGSSAAAKARRTAAKEDSDKPVKDPATEPEERDAA